MYSFFEGDLELTMQSVANLQRRIFKDSREKDYDDTK